MISVLVVDDNLELSGIIAKYLSMQKDIEVCGVCYDGKRAVDLVREVRPDLLLLDLGLPLLDGLEVLDALRGELPKVLVITAFSRQDILQRAMQKGASYCLVKPFYLSVLARIIKEVCSFKEEMVLDKNGFGSFLGDDMLVKYIEDFLTASGIKQQLKGYKYLKEALYLAIDNQALLFDALNKALYPALASRFNTSPSNVEAAIRGAITSAWQYNQSSMVKLITQKDDIRVKRKPTTSQFLSIARRHIQTELRQTKKELLL